MKFDENKILQSFEFGDNKELSYGRCKKQKSYNELFDGLNNLE